MRTLLFGSLWAFVSLANQTPKLTPVPRVDLERYAGVWHEIARLPNSFETSCAHSTAEYTPTPDGHLNILNRCVKANGYTREARGVGRVENSPSNSTLRVNFVPHWLRWSGLGWEDYWIIDLDPSYQYAVVSEPNRDYLWILSRTPTMRKNIYDAIIAKLENWHFHLSHLIVSGEIVSKSQSSEPLVLEAFLFR